MGKKYMGIDASTQSMSALVIDVEKGRIEAEESINFDDHFQDRYGVANGVVERAGGEVHSFPLMWVEALDRLLDTLRRQGCDLGAIGAIGGAGQQHGTVYLNGGAGSALGGLRADAPLVDQLGDILSRPSSPIWMDTSTAVQCAEIEAGVGGREALLELTGNTAFERFSGPQIRKFWQVDPVGYEATSYIGLVSSFMASLLRGQLVAVDPGDGSGTNMMDIKARQWSPQALAATAPELAERLLPIAPAEEIAGPISPYFVGRYGFAADCQVVPFSGDNPCSLIGMGLVEPGQVALSLGTSDTLFACMDAPRVSAAGEGAVFASPDGRHYMALICFLNGSLAREAVRDQYGLDWDGFTAALQETTAGNGGALMLPYFAPEIVPKVARPMVVRQGLEEGDAAANVRGVVEAQALSSRLHAEWMGVAIQSLYVTGGASANVDILRVYANVHNCPVHRFDTTNAAGLGAALRAWYSYQRAQGEGLSWRQVVDPFTQPVAGSTIAPEPAAAALYDGLVEQYRRLENEHIQEA